MNNQTDTQDTSDNALYGKVIAVVNQYALDGHISESGVTGDACQAIREALGRAGQSEPVAWRVKVTSDRNDSWTAIHGSRRPGFNEYHTIEPLYLGGAGQSPTVPTAVQIERLQHAIEGECEGLAIDQSHAKAILQYVFGAGS